MLTRSEFSQMYAAFKAGKIIVMDNHTDYAEQFAIWEIALRLDPTLGSV